MKLKLMTWVLSMPVPKDKEGLAIKFWWAYELLQLNFIYTHIHVFVCFVSLIHWNRTLNFETVSLEMYRRNKYFSLTRKVEINFDKYKLPIFSIRGTAFWFLNMSTNEIISKNLSLILSRMITHLLHEEKNALRNIKTFQ